MKKLFFGLFAVMAVFILVACSTENGSTADDGDDNTVDVGEENDNAADGDEENDSNADVGEENDSIAREFDEFTIRNIETEQVAGLEGSLEDFEQAFGEAEFHRENSDGSREYTFLDAGSDFLVRFTDNEAVNIRVSRRYDDVVEFYGDLNWDMDAGERLVAYFVNSPSDSFFHRRYMDAEGVWQERSTSRDGDILANYLSMNVAGVDDGVRIGVIEIYIPGNR